MCKQTGSTWRRGRLTGRHQHQDEHLKDFPQYMLHEHRISEYMATTWTMLALNFDLCLLKPCLIICLCLGAAFLWYFVHRSCRKTAQRTVFLCTSDGSSSVKSGIISKHWNVSWASLSHSHYSQPIVIYHYLLLLYFLCLFAEYALLIIIILIIMLLLPSCVDVSLKSCHGNSCLKLFSNESFSSKHEKGLCT